MSGLSEERLAHVKPRRDRRAFFEQACHRRPASDFQQPRLLCVVQGAFDANLALDVTLLVLHDQLELHLDAPDRPAVAFGVHAQGDRRARAQRAERQLGRVGGRVAAAVIDWLVDREVV